VGWKQVWEDIRHAVRPRASAGEDQQDQETKDKQDLEAPELPPHQDMEPAASAAHLQVPPVSVEAPPAETAPGEPEGDAVSFPADLEAEPAGHARTPKRARLLRWGPAALAVLLLAGLGVYFLLPDPVGVTGRRPPAPNVVATFTGGRITIEDVRRHLVELVPDKETQRSFQEVEDYLPLVEEMITEELVRRWAAGRKADRDQDFQHVMQHITEEINLDELHAQLHQGPMGITEAEVRSYYDANRRQFGNLTLEQVRAQIRTRLQQQREGRFVQEYLARLKEMASVTRDFALLAVPEPGDRELQAYYGTNRSTYLLPAQAVVDEIRVDVGQDEAAAREKAGRALTRLRAGEDFAAVARDLSGTPPQPQGTSVRKGERDPAYDAAVFALDPGQVSDVIKAGDAFYVVRLRTRAPERQQSFGDVRDQVRQAVRAQKEEQWFTENGDRTLFTIRGKRFTLGEFWKEYRELPEDFLARYQGVAGRRALAERLIERLLLLQDSYDRLLQSKNKVQLEEARLSVLAQMLEQEEVDDKIKVSDEELSAYYQEHRKDLTEPPQVKIRAIVIRLGQTGQERVGAFAKATEAYKQLVPGPLQKGRDFAQVARQYSEDPATAARGGDLDGWIREGPDLLAEMAVHPFHEQTLGLQLGEISRPFEWRGAIYIVQVRERQEARQLTFEEAKEFLREELRQKKHDELSAELSKRLLTQARVMIYERTLQQLAKEATPAEGR